MGTVLFEHNQTAYDAAVSMLELTGKAAVIHPTGTGKSFIAFKLCDENPDKRICWLSPSEYIFWTQVENWKSACQGEYILSNICFYTYAKLMRMDQKQLEEIKPDYIILDEFHRCGAVQWGGGVGRLREQYPCAKVLGLSATSIRYLDNQRDMALELFGGNIASELTLGEALARGILPMPNYILAVYSYQKELLRYETRIRQTKGRAVRDAAEKQLEALRRALEKADGLDTIFARYLMSKEVALAGETPEETKISEEEILQDKKYGRYLVFCASYDHLNEMREIAREWFAKVDPAPHIYTAYSDDPDTEKEFQAFKTDDSRHLKLLYCIDMFNEGIHIDVDGVILLRPTVSPTIYKQQIGRALAAGGKKTPIIFDIVMNIENLSSIGAVEEEFYDAILSYRALGREDKIVDGNFRIIDEVRDCRKLFAQLNETLGASWDAMFCRAEEYFRAHGNLEVPKRYTTPEGYSLGAWIATQRKVYAGKAAGNLSQMQVEKLNRIGMQWQGKRELAWERHYAEAVRYYKEHGNLLVGISDGKKKDTRDGDYTGLARWLARLRAMRKKMMAGEQKKEPDRGAYLTPERIAALDAIGMVWDAGDVVWEEHFAAARQYFEEHGDLAVPSCYVDGNGIRLGAWLAKQRKRWQQGKEMKENCGIKTVAEQKTERENIQPATTASRKPEVGDNDGLSGQKNIRTIKRDFCFEGCENPPETSGKKSLEQHKQKPGYSDGLTQKQIDRLTAIGMDWEGKNHTTWETSYAAACNYQKQHGNLDIPASYITKDGCHLGRWIRRQRDRYHEIAKEYEGNAGKEQNLLQERIQKLEQIGMDWGEKDPWQERFRLAKKYYGEHGNLDMPGDYVTNGVWLARWIREQRARLEEIKADCSRKEWDGKDTREDVFAPEKEIGKRRKGTKKRDRRKSLTKEQIGQLASIGICSRQETRAEIAWMEQYREAKEYFRVHGNLSVPKRYTGSGGRCLGSWLQRQRTGRKNGALQEGQIQLLDEVGMVWEPEQPWTAGYEHAKRYFNEYGNLEVPNAYVSADGYRLGRWISNQRSAYSTDRKNMDQEKIKKLEEIGMVWNVFEYRRNIKTLPATKLDDLLKNRIITNGEISDGVLK